MKKAFGWGVATAAFALILGASAFDVATAQEAKKAKNVILFIGDGMGFNSDILGTYWRYGEADAQSYHKFPVKLGAATFCVKEEYDPKKDDGYPVGKIWEGPESAMHRLQDNCPTTDSAASGTAINTGVKTQSGRVGFSKDGKKLENFADMNYRAGRSVGVVTTVQISHATPATTSAHNMSRGNYEEISKEQINDLPLTVLFGAGHPAYNRGAKINKKPEDLNYQFVGGREVWEAVSKDEGYKGWKFIDEREKFAELAKMTPDTNPTDLPKKILGIGRDNGDMLPIDGFADDESFVQERYSKEALANTPTLTDMTLGALNVLAQNDKGFYLMVEGGAIDHANHGRNAQNSALEHASFSKAIDAAIAWVEKYSSWDDTIMIITSDHETGCIWGPGTFEDMDENGKFDPKKDEFNEFEELEESDIGECPEVQYLSSGHSHWLVPVYAKGQGVESVKEFIRGNDEEAADMWDFSGDFIYNTDIFNLMKAASGLK
ncbi:MAG: alkaline phosphatase [Thermoguttaceae bacterium]|nr:alkaline phosphatase [Thermoguttaceae bacterium]